MVLSSLCSTIGRALVLSASSLIGYSLLVKLVIFSILGLLLYPDTPTKMETTSHLAFCHKSVPLPERRQRLHSDGKQLGSE